MQVEPQQQAPMQTGKKGAAKKQAAPANQLGSKRKTKEKQKKAGKEVPELEDNEHLAGGSVRSWETEEEEEEGDGKMSSMDSKQKRLEKNRESARESRKRKKNYI